MPEKILRQETPRGWSKEHIGTGCVSSWNERRGRAAPRARASGHEHAIGGRTGDEAEIRTARRPPPRALPSTGQSTFRTNGSPTAAFAARTEARLAEAASFEGKGPTTTL